MNSDEYRRLPPRIRDEDEFLLNAEDKVRDIYREIALSFCMTRIRTAPLGFSATFRRGSSSVGDKVFEFEDRRQRTLMLSPDSTPLVLRHHLEMKSDGVEGRYAFLSPVFRYRNGLQRRFFHHLGFAIVDGEEQQKAESACPGLGLIEIATAMAKMLRLLNLPFLLHITDFGEIRDCLANLGLSEVARAGDFLNKLRPLDSTARKEVIESQLFDCDARGRLVRMLTSSMEELDSPAVPKSLKSFGRLLEAGGGTSVRVNMADLHSSEVIDGPALRFAMPGGGYYGDGGSYGLFARAFDPSLKTLISVACGLEMLAEHVAAAEDTRVKERKAAVVLALDASLAFVLRVSAQLRDDGFSVVCRQVGKKLGNDLRRSAAAFSHFAVIGAEEEKAGLYKLKRASDRQEVTIRLRGDANLD